MIDDSATGREATPTPARDVRPHDHVVGAGTVRWVMPGLMAKAHGSAQAHALLPHGGTLLTFTNSTQMGVFDDVDLMVYRLALANDEEPCPERNMSLGCVYRAGHDASVFPHRFTV